jgi:hypothetical protein
MEQEYNSDEDNDDEDNDDDEDDKVSDMVIHVPLTLWKSLSIFLALQFFVNAKNFGF